MKNCIEDITPGEFRGYVTASTLRGADEIIIDTDSDIYEYGWLFWFADDGAGVVVEPTYYVNGSRPTFTNRCDVLGNGTTEFGRYSASTGQMYTRDSQGLVSANFGRCYVKDGETAKFFTFHSLAGGNGADANEVQSNEWTFPTTKVTTIGFSALNTGQSCNYLFRFYRWPRGLPFNFGDMLASSKDITTEQVFSIAPLDFQSIGFEWQGNTKFSMDINNNESSGFYDHNEIRNTTTNNAAPSALGTTETLINSGLTHCTGKISDIPDTQKVMEIAGAGHLNAPTTAHAFYVMTGDEGNNIDTVDFKPDGTLDGTLDFQINPIFPFCYFPLELIYQKNISSENLNTLPLDISIPTGYTFLFIRAMLTCGTSTTLSVTINDLTSGYSEKVLRNNGSTSHVSDNTTSKNQMAQVNIGTDTIGNYLELLVNAIPVDTNLYTGMYSIPDGLVAKVAGNWVDDTDDISSVQVVGGASVSTYSGRVQVFGIL